ncbi:hypothetical protein EDB85DRAFT_2223610 [Lactarius pseudohatsudake]|nr:hypothetical protein EDB85DRAFT_2223610 [Lactarius pseudohatsudake]
MHTLASVIAAQLGSLADLKTYVAAAAQGMNSGGGAGSFVWLVTDTLGRLGVVATYGSGTLLITKCRQSLLTSDGTKLGGVYQPGARASGSVHPTNVWSDWPLAPSDRGAVDGSNGMYGVSEAPHPTPPHGAVSTWPPPPPDSTHHTGTAATATSRLHLSSPHLYY